MKNKMLSNIVFILVSLIIVGGAAAKIFGLKSAVEQLSRHGVGNYVRALGVMELFFTILFVYPKTFRLGFILLCCYFGGAIATHLSHGANIMQPAIPLIFIWIAAFLKDRSVFLGKTDLSVRTPLVIL